MKLPKLSIPIVLVGLYVAAVAVRGMDAGRSNYPYFNDVSATSFRYAFEVARTGAVPALDRKAAWPEGIAVARDRPLGLEYALGFSYRLVKYFSEVDERTFTKQFSRLFLSLLVLSMYGLTLTLWQNRPVALLAAGLIAFFHPLVRATGGNTFPHFQFAVVLISLHLTLLLRARRGPSLKSAALAAAVGFLLLAAWAEAAVYLALVMLIYAAWPAGGRPVARPVVALQLLSFLAAAFFLPHLSAQLAAFSWPAAGLYIAVLYSVAGRRLPPRTGAPWSGGLYLVAGTVLLTAVLRPIHSGGLQSASFLQYCLYRLRYLAAKPVDPNALPLNVRYLWTAEHSPPDWGAAFRTLSPFVFFIPGLILTFRAVRKSRPLRPATDDPAMEAASEPTVGAGAYRPLLGFAGLGVALFLADRSMLPLALLGLVPLAAASALEVGRARRVRIFLAALGALVILGQTVPGSGRLDLVRAVTRAGALPADAADEFLRFSIGEPDQSLLRFVFTRTSIQAPILSLPRSSSPLVAFSGRTTLLVPGIRSKSMIEKTYSYLDGWYKGEDEFYDLCRTSGVEYVLYSIDLLLDESTFSPAYFSGRRRIQPASTAYKMHFFPETLKHFNLIYENDVYRLFKVAIEPLPIFLTDHPPAYQYEIIQRNNDTLAGFYERVRNLLLLYNHAREQLVAGNDAGALGAFEACISQAPHFTAANLGRAAALSNLNRLEAARDAYLFVIGYAPDNPEALYGIALSLARLGDKEQAKAYIDILMSSTGDKEMKGKAKLLSWFIEQNIPIDSAPEAPDSVR